MGNVEPVPPQIRPRSLYVLLAIPWTLDGSWTHMSAMYRSSIRYGLCIRCMYARCEHDGRRRCNDGWCFQPNLCAQHMDTLPLSDGRTTKEHLSEISRSLGENVGIREVAYRFQPPGDNYIGTFVQGTG